jgi:mannose-1-phosphate guanylyltransferase
MAATGTDEGTGRAPERPLFAILMAGGSGTRFWPASRAARPKQLVAVSGERTLLQSALDRVRPLVPPERVLVVTAKAHARAVARQLPEIPKKNLLVEPVGRNTAACAGLATCEALARDPNALLALFPADHVIADTPEWRRLLVSAARVVSERDTVVTFGLPANRPETGFGYIRAGAPVAERLAPGMREVAGFVEKPDLETARRFVSSGEWLWNSGVFVVRARRLRELIDEHQPKIGAGLARIERATGAAARRRALAEVYPELPAVSLDGGVMERVPGMVLMPARVGWSDVGSWSALDEVLPVDAAGNVARGPVLALDASGCVLYSSGALIAALGVKDLIVVQTEDAVLVCPKDRAQDVRQVVDRLKQMKKERLL